jgi:hypothetical protein
MSHIIPVAWQHDTEPDTLRLRMSEMVPIRLERTVGFDGVVYAIRQGGCCLNKKGEWEFEPIPSSRTDAFLKRCRWKDFEKAYAVFAALDPKGRMES